MNKVDPNASLIDLIMLEPPRIRCYSLSHHRSTNVANRIDVPNELVSLRILPDVLVDLLLLVNTDHPNERIRRPCALGARCSQYDALEGLDSKSMNLLDCEFAGA